MKNNTIRENLNALQLSDIYSLMFFILLKTQDVPEYATLSELCYLLDGNNLLRLITYFAGKTVTFPSADELSILVDALLVYKYVTVDGLTLSDAINKLTGVTTKQIEAITALYLKIIPVMNSYNIDRSKVSKNDR